SVAPQVEVCCETELDRPQAPSTGEKEKYMKALNEAIAMGRRSTWASVREVEAASDSRCNVEAVKHLPFPIQTSKEIPAANHKVICHGEDAIDEDVPQIWDQKHQSIEVEGEIKETVMEPPSEEETSSQTQEIPAGNQGDQDMLQNIGFEDKNKEPAMEETTLETQEIPSGNQKVMHHEDEEGMLHIWHQKHQNIEFEDENKELTMKETTSETQEVPARNQKVMCHEEDNMDEDVLQIWDQNNQSFEVEDEIKETAMKTPSEKEETNPETQEIPAGNQKVTRREEDKDMLEIWDEKLQSIEFRDENKDFTMEENTLETLEIPARNQEVMYHEEDTMDEDKRQIWDQNHQNIEFEDKNQEFTMEENTLETQEIPARNQEVMYHEEDTMDEEKHQIWDQNHQNIEVKDEIKETAMETPSEKEETNPETQEIPAGNQEDQDMLQIWDQKLQNIEFEDKNKELTMEETTLETQEIPARNQNVMDHEEDEDMLQIWGQKCQMIEVEGEINDTAMESSCEGEETNLETQENPARNQEDEDLLQIWDQKHQSNEFQDENKERAMEETTSETQQRENLMLGNEMLRNNIESFVEECIEEAFADLFKCPQLLFFNKEEPVDKSINVQPYGEFPLYIKSVSSAEQNQMEDQPQDESCFSCSYLNEQSRFQTSVLTETKVHELNPGPNGKKEVAQEIKQEVHERSASPVPHMEVTNPSVHRGHRVTAALTNDGNSLFLLASRLEVFDRSLMSVINYTSSSDAA
ncbi:hypothetical protein M9458_005104, partial [Cirrhinus mrigala]